MKLNSRIALNVGLLIAAVWLALFIVASWVVLSEFDNLEKTQEDRNLNRVLRALENQQQSLLISAADWGNWDATAQYIQDQNAAFAQENLVAKALEDLGIQVLLIADLEGRLIWGKAQGAGDAGLVEPSASLLASLGKLGVNTNVHSDPAPRSGIIRLPEGLFLLAVHPVHTSTGEGPSQGTVFMGRSLDSVFVEQMGLDLSLELSLQSEEGGPTDAPRWFSGNRSSYLPLNNMEGQSAGSVRLDMPRDVHGRGGWTISLFGVVMLVSGFLFAGVLHIRLNRLVVSRLQHLSTVVRRVALHTESSEPITLSGSDELSSLAGDINRLMLHREEARRTLAESQIQFQVIFQQMINGFALHEIICDAQGKPVDYRFLAVNPAFERMTGLKAEALLGRRVLEVLPQTESYWIETYGRVALTGEPVEFENYATGLNKHFEVTAFRPAPQQFVTLIDDITLRKKAEARNSELLEENRQARVALLGILEDQQKAEAERQKLADQLLQAQKMELVGRLAGGVAHDLNNMLQAILGHVELLMMKCRSSGDLLADLEEIRKSAQRSADLTRQLLGFARKQTILPRVIDFNMTINSMLAMLRRLLGEDIDLVWNPCAASTVVKMDPAQIDQILVNLTVNARDAIIGTGCVTVETEIIKLGEDDLLQIPELRPGPYVILRVIDNGCGMSLEVQGKIFEPFFTTKAVGRGTGLGLSTVYGMVRQNNGAISVKSESGKGSTFTLYLPRVELVEGLSASAGVAESAPPQGIETVLVAEDEPSIRIIVRRFLESLGYSVLVAETPADAMALSDTYTGDIQLLITDVIMPGMSGRELNQQLQAKRPSLKCLYISGYTAEIIAERGILGKTVALLHKPFAREQLASKVREVLDGA